MDVASTTSIHHDDAYESKLAELSRQFWDSYGDQQTPDILDHGDRVEWGRMVTPPDPLEINGVRMTQTALDQLKLQGLPVHWYTSDELEDAVIACQADATLIDDPDGHTLEDKLYLEAHEKPGAEELPVLHGFHPDEYDRIITGIRMLSDPLDISHCDLIRNGLEGAPHLVHEHDMVCTL